MAHRICNDCGFRSSLPYVVCKRCHGEMMPDPAYELNDLFDDHASETVELDLADVETRPADMTDQQIDLRRERALGIQPWWKSGAKEDREYYGRNYR